SEITQGTFDIRLGGGDVKTITVNSNNNSLSGFADAINSAGAGVTATVVKDSGGGATPYRLLLSSTKSGAENAISITNSLAADNGGAIQPVIDFGTPVQEAADAQVTIGSGAGAISVSSSNNQFSDVIRGLRIDLLQAEPGQEITLTVNRDVDGAVDAVSNFVDSFNAILTYIDDQSFYNAATNTGGPLLGNRSATRIQQQLQSAALEVVAGANPSANRLSAIGVTFSNTGRLQFNDTKLRSILNGEVDGVTAADVRRLFALDGSSSNSGITWSTGTSNTKAAETPYEVDITQAAERAAVTAGSALSGSTVITGANNTLELAINGRSATVTLDAGTYTDQELADHLEAVINGATDLAGRTVSVGLGDGKLTITSDSFGSSSEVELSGGTGLADLGFTIGQTDTGLDVAGSFIVNGNTEAANGRGQLLTGDSDNANTAGIQLRVTLNSNQVISGADGELTVTRGISALLDQTLKGILDQDTGDLATVDKGFTSQLDSLKLSLDRQQAAFDRQRVQLQNQFVALETSISQLQSLSTSLGQQLAAIPKIGSN
ncbi:MAG: flagellar filament capping protein FliD, partial [Planctomycetaceae bacterium]|nr:flagellar filament capping protein FliD [Planctomycetaceae bacterium]